MSLVNTLMQTLRTKYTGAIDKKEIRASRYGAWDFFNTQSNSPDSIFDSEIVKTIKESFGNTVVIPVLDAKTVTIGNVRSCIIADDENTSNLKTLVFVTYAFGFTMYPAQYKNNDVKYEQDFTRKLNYYLLALAAALDTKAVATLEANKNQYWTGVTGNPYPVTSNALQVTQAQKDDFYNQLTAIMETLDLYGNTNVISSTSGSPMVRRLQAQGLGSDTNDAFQLTPYDDFYWTNRIPNAGGIQSTLYAVEDGTVAFASRVDPDAQMRHRIGDQMEWDTVNVPLPNSPYGVEMGTFYRKDCADGSNLSSGTTNLKRTLKESFEWSFDACFEVVYNSSPSTRATPIVKVEISAS